MNNKWKQAIIIALTSVCLTTGAAFANNSQTASEVQEIKDAFIGMQNVLFQIGCFKSENGKTDILNENEIQTYIDNFNAQVDRYYTSGLQQAGFYKQTNEKLLREICTDKISYCVEGGVVDCDFNRIDVSEDGNTAVVDAVCTSWCSWVEENENGSLEVTAPMSKDNIIVIMVKEDGLWKLKSTDKMNVHFSADVLSELDNKTDAIKKYEEITHETQYNSFDEALAAAQSLDPEEINPFELLNS